MKSVGTEVVSGIWAGVQGGKAMLEDAASFIGITMVDSTKAVLGIQHESAQISFWERLSELTCPILILRGGKPTSSLNFQIGF